MESGSGGVNRVVEESKYSRVWSLGEFVVHDPFKESRKLYKGVGCEGFKFEGEGRGEH